MKTQLIAALLFSTAIIAGPAFANGDTNPGNNNPAVSSYTVATLAGDNNPSVSGDNNPGVSGDNNPAVPSYNV